MKVFKVDLYGPLGQVLTQAEDVAEGCQALQAALNISPKYNESVIRGSITAVRDAEGLAAAARVLENNSTGSRRFTDEAGKQFIRAARKVLQHYHGERFSNRWVETGFPNQSLSVPTKTSERVDLLKSLELYFAKYANHENAGLGVTSAKAGTLYEQLSTARSTCNACGTDVEQKADTLEAAVRNLRNKLRGLVNELKDALNPTDARWETFGLNAPGAEKTPAMPENVKVDDSLAGKLLVTCDPVPNASHYRFWKQTPIVDEHPVAVGTSQEPQFIIEGLPQDTNVRVFVSAVNAEGDEGELSEPVDATPRALAA